VEHIYRRSLLVLWPHSQSLANAQRAGLPALLSVLKQCMANAEALQHNGGSGSSGSDRPGTEQQQQQQPPEQKQQQQQGGDAEMTAAGADQNRSGGSSSGKSSSSRKQQRKFAKAGAEVSAALHVCAAVLSKLLLQQQQQPPQPTYSSYSYRTSSMLYNSNRNHIEQVITVLQQGTKAVQMGIQGAGKHVVKLVLAVASSPAGLTDDTLAAAVAAAARVLDAAAVGQQLGQLISRSMESQPARCIKLIQGVANTAEPGLQQQLASAALSALPGAAVDPLLILAAAVTDLPALQQQVVDKVAAAVAGDTTAGIALKVAPLLYKLQLQPQLQQQLSAAVAAVLTVAGPLQHLKSIVLLVETCRGQQQLQQQLVGAVCGALHGPIPIWQVSEIQQLVSALRSAQPLQQQVQEAIVESIFGNVAMLPLQTSASMLELSGLLLQVPQFKETCYGRFAAAAAQHPSNYDLLLQLLQSQHVKVDGTAVELLAKATTTMLRSLSSITMFSSLAWQVTRLTPLVEALQSHPDMQQLLRAAVVESVFSSGSLLSGQNDDSMLQLAALLQQSDQLMTAYLEQFAAGVTHRPDNTSLLQKLLQPAVLSTAARTRLVSAAVAVICSRSSAWQVRDALPVLEALRDAPALQQRVQAAIAQRVFIHPGVLAVQSNASMLLLSELLLGNPQLRAAYCDHYAIAVGQQRDSYDLLKQLLASGAVKGALAMAEVQQLVALQIANLERLSAVPAFTWHMPEARLPSYSTVRNVTNIGLFMHLHSML